MASHIWKAKMLMIDRIDPCQLAPVSLCRAPLTVTGREGQWSAWQTPQCVLCARPGPCLQRSAAHLRQGSAQQQCHVDRVFVLLLCVGEGTKQRWSS